MTRHSAISVVHNTVQFLPTCAALKTGSAKCLYMALIASP